MYCDFTNLYQKTLSSNSSAADRNKASEHDRIVLKSAKTEIEKIIKYPEGLNCSGVVTPQISSTEVVNEQDQMH